MIPCCTPREADVILQQTETGDDEHGKETEGRRGHRDKVGRRDITVKETGGETLVGWEGKNEERRKDKSERWWRRVYGGGGWEERVLPGRHN